MNYIPYNHDCIYNNNVKNYEKMCSQILDLVSSVEKKNEDNSLIQNHVQVLVEERLSLQKQIHELTEENVKLRKNEEKLKNYEFIFEIYNQMLNQNKIGSFDKNHYLISIKMKTQKLKKIKI